MDWQTSIILLVIIGAIVCYTVVKKINNRKEAQTGEDKARLRQAAMPLLGEGGMNPVLYAHWEKRESYGRTVKTTYYRYAVTYQGDSICIAPLQVDKSTRQMQIARPFIYTPENLGKIAITKREKDGVVKHLELVLADKQGNTVFQLYVDAENLRSNRYFPVNIEQQEECAAFERFITALSQRIAGENPGVDELIKANDNKSIGTLGMIVSIIGAVFALFMPPAGFVLALIGLCLSVVSKVRGAKSKAALIISIVCMLWSAGFLWMYLTYMV